MNLNLFEKLFLPGNVKYSMTELEYVYTLANAQNNMN